MMKLNFSHDAFILPASALSHLSGAQDAWIRVLLWLASDLSLADKPKQLAKLADTDQKNVKAALQYFTSVGVLTDTENSLPAMAQSEATPITEVAAPSKQILRRADTLPQYTSTELGDLLEQRASVRALVDEAQRIYGKMFRVYDTGILVGIVDQLGFEEEAVLAILAYTVRKGKKTLRYAERVAMAFYDEGITETGAVLDRIHRMEQAAETVEKIKNLFGMGSRELSATEKKLFSTWTEQYGYDIDVVRLAYDITVDTIQKPVPKYAGSILDSWHKEGLRTEDEVLRYIESQKAGKKAAEESEHTPKSYDLDEFFEAALKRGLKDLS